MTPGPRPGTTPPRPPWLDWVPGERVVVLHRTTPDGGRTESLGTLVSTDLHGVVIDTRQGRVQVHASTMITGKRVGPARPRGGRQA